MIWKSQIYATLTQVRKDTQISLYNYLTLLFITKSKIYQKILLYVIIDISGVDRTCQMEIIKYLKN